MNMNNFDYLTVDKELAQPHAHEPASLEPNDNELDVTPQFLQAIENGENTFNSFADVVKFFTELFSEITNRIFGQLGGWTHSKTDNDKTTLAVDIQNIYNALDTIFSKYKGYSSSQHSFNEKFIDTGVTVNIPPNVDYWNKQLSPLFSVDDQGGVSMDTSMLQELLKSVIDFEGSGGSTAKTAFRGKFPWGFPMHKGKLPPELLNEFRDSWIGVNPAAYDAWKTGFGSIKDQMETALQTLVTKYAHQNSNFDSMAKVISSSISSMAEMKRCYLNT
ncbi:hypothetical protein AU476_09480 [Cupriavidus sp. UYMSc13B]|nr:hypothetical protein AU476_09480 [Cupriavidus sp. UYMSc13B]